MHREGRLQFVAVCCLSSGFELHAGDQPAEGAGWQSLIQFGTVTSSSVNQPSDRIVSVQRWSIALLIAGGALNYIDRATLSVANKLIQDDLGIPVAKMGLLLSAFLWAYAVAQLPVGGLIDRFGPRKLLAAGLFSWSIAQAAGGLVRGFGVFIAARVALGLGEAPLFPGGARVIRDWFGVRER